MNVLFLIKCTVFIVHKQILVNHLNRMYEGHKPKVPFCLSKKRGQARINKENSEKNGVNNGKTGEKLGEGRDDVVASKDKASQAIGNDSKNTDNGQTVTLKKSRFRKQ